MEENRKNDQKIQELDLEKLEQVSGGNGFPPRIQLCPNCNQTTAWIYQGGVWVCGKCSPSAIF